MAKAKAAILEGRRPCLFLSHSGVDSDAAKALKTRIMSTKAAREAGLEVWFDKDDLLPGVEDWQTQLEKALGRATAFAVMVGSKGVVNWVEREVRVALSRATGPDAIPFIPVIARDSPGVAALPAFAQQHQGVFDPLGNDEELRRLVAAALSTKPSKVPLLDEPFVGLRSMTEADAGRFFGRDEEVKDLVALLKRHRLLAVVADSGAGKSSLAMAGLVPAFRGGAFADPSRREPDGRIWHVIVMRPGNDPVEGLRRGVTEVAEKMNVSAGERAMLRKRLDLADVAESAFALRCDLPADRTETLLVVDQFDELLTETPEANRAPFVDFLTRLASLREPGGVRVVLTVRADYFNLCRPFEELYRLLADADDPAAMRLKRISDPGLEQAVKRPLELAGYERPDDAERLARRTRLDLGDRAGDLALAQMALYVVWKRRHGPDGTLLDAYADVGGVTGALAQEAERIRTEKLTKAEAALLTPLFVRLVRLGDTGGAVRRICRRDELDPARQALADRLCSDAHGRLLLASDDTYEVCHEALITQWPWLQDELNRVAADLRDLDPLMRRASLWAVAPEADKRGHLATGVEREAFAALTARRDGWLSEDERTFVGASHEAFARERETRDRERRFRKWVTRGAVAASVLLAALAAFAGWSAWEARRQQEIAVAEAGRADAAAEEARRAAIRAMENETVSLAALSRVALSEMLPVEAVKLALAAWPRAGDESRPASARSVASMVRAIPELRERLRIEGHEDAVDSAVFSPDGKRIVTASWDKTARIWDAATGAPLLVLSGHQDTIASAAFSPDGTRVITASWDRTARIWDATTGEQSPGLGRGATINSAVFSPDGRRIVVAEGSDARVYDAATRALLLTLEAQGGVIYSVAVSQDNGRIATASSDGKARIWNAADGSLALTLEGHATKANFASFSPDGALVVTASDDDTARIWGGDAPRTLEGHSGDVNTAAFSPDGTRIVTASDDRTAIVWDSATGTALFTLVGHTSAVKSATFSPDGALILTASDDGSARVWDATSPQTAWLKGNGGQALSAVFSPDGARIVTGHLDGTARIWDTPTVREMLALKGHTNRVQSASFAPDGARVVTASSDKTARVWEVGTGELRSTFVGHREAVLSGSFSPDGTRIVTGSLDGTARVWDVTTSAPLLTLDGGDRQVVGASYSRDGDRIVTVTSGRIVRIWEAATGALMLELQGRFAVRSAEVSPDGKRVVIASVDGTAEIRDARTGAPMLILEGHSGWVQSAVFSTDGSRIITAADDKTVRVWDAATGAQLLSLRGHRESVRSAEISQDGARIVTTSNDRTARIWDISSLEKGDAFQIACQRLGNNTSLKDVQERYGLGELTPVCGDNPPLPVDWTKLQ